MMPDQHYTLSLEPLQITVLIGACEDYRAYAWEEIAPSEARNYMMRTAQAMEGRLIEMREGSAPYVLSVSSHEKQCLVAILPTVIKTYNRMQRIDTRAQMIANLARILILLGRMPSYHQASAS